MRIVLWIILFFFSTNIFAATTAIPFPNYGVSFSHTVISKDPTNAQGTRAGLWYQPPSFIWSGLHLSFDVSYGHWWVTSQVPHKTISIYAAAPILRYYFIENNSFSPFFNISLGLAYITRTRFADRNLGMHFSFQDQLGMGVTMGAKHQFSLVFNAVHYSNGSLCAMNAGITIPLMITAEYGFG